MDFFSIRIRCALFALVVHVWGSFGCFITKAIRASYWAHTCMPGVYLSWFVLRATRKNLNRIYAHKRCGQYVDTPSSQNRKYFRKIVFVAMCAHTQQNRSIQTTCRHIAHRSSPNAARILYVFPVERIININHQFGFSFIAFEKHTYPNTTTTRRTTKIAEWNDMWLCRSKATYYYGKVDGRAQYTRNMWNWSLCAWFVAVI